MSCINVNSIEFKFLLDESNLQEQELVNKITDFQSFNNTDEFPTLEELGIQRVKKTETIKSGVSELFESNPELASQIYEAAGFTTKADVILPIGTSGSGKSTFIKSLPQENLVVIEPDAMRVEFTGNMNDKSKDKEIYEEAAKRAITAIKQGKQVVFDTTNLTKDKRLPFIEAIKKEIPNATIQYKLMELNPELAKQRIKAQLERGENRAAVSDETIDRHAASYKQMLKDIKNEPINNFEITLQQKQEALQLYSQYLDTIFPESKVQKIVYHSSDKIFDKFNTVNIRGNKGTFFSTDSNYTKFFGDNLYTVLLNIKNPVSGEEYEGYGDALTEADYSYIKEYRFDGVIGHDALLDVDNISKGIEYIVLEPEQIYILGNKQDIENFRNWINKNNQLTQVPEQAKENYPGLNEKLYNQLYSFCKLLNPNFKIEVLDRVLDGSVEANGLADIANAYIAIREGRLDTLSEEVAHFYIELMSDNEHLNSLIKDIKTTEIYKQTYNDYYHIYKDENKVAKEAIGKLISQYINKEDTHKSISRTNLWSQIIQLIENFLRDIGMLNMNEYQKIASKILVGDVSQLDIHKTINEIYYNINNDFIETLERTYTSLMGEDKALIVTSEIVAEEIKAYSETRNANKNILDRIYTHDVTAIPGIKELDSSNYKSILKAYVLAVDDSDTTITLDGINLNQLATGIASKTKDSFTPMDKRKILDSKDNQLRNAFLNFFDDSNERTQFAFNVRNLVSILKDLNNNVKKDELLQVLFKNDFGTYDIASDKISKLEKVHKLLDNQLRDDSLSNLEAIQTFIDAVESIQSIFHAVIQKKLLLQDSLDNSDTIDKLSSLARTLSTITRITLRLEKEFTEVSTKINDSIFTEWFGSTLIKINQSKYAAEQLILDLVTEAMMKPFDIHTENLDKDIEELQNRNISSPIIQEAIKEKIEYLEKTRMTKETLKSILKGEKGDIGGKSSLAGIRTLLELHVTQGSISRDPIITAFQQLISDIELKAFSDTYDDLNEVKDELHDALNKAMESTGLNHYQLGNLLKDRKLESYKESIPVTVIRIENGTEVEEILYIEVIKVRETDSILTEHNTEAHIAKEIKNQELINAIKLKEKGYIRYKDNIISSDYYKDDIIDDDAISNKEQELDDWKRNHFYRLEKDIVLEELNNLKLKYNTEIEIDGKTYTLYEYLSQEQSKLYFELGELRKQIESPELSLSDIEMLNGEMRQIHAKIYQLKLGEYDGLKDYKDEVESYFKDKKEYNDKYYEYNPNFNVFYRKLNNILEDLSRNSELDLKSLFTTLIKNNTKDDKIDHKQALYQFVATISSPSYNVKENQKESLKKLITFLNNNVVFRPNSDYYETRGQIYLSINQINARNNVAKYHLYTDETDANTALLGFDDKHKVELIDLEGSLYYAITKSNGAIASRDGADIDTLWLDILEIVRPYRNQQGDVLNLPLDLQKEVTDKYQAIEDLLVELKKDTKIDKSDKAILKALTDELGDLHYKKLNVFYYNEFQSKVEDIYTDNYQLTKLKTLLNPEAFLSYLDSLMKDNLFISYIGEYDNNKIELDNVKQQLNKLTIEDFKDKANPNFAYKLAVQKLNKQIQEIEFKQWFLSNHITKTTSIKVGDEYESVKVFSKSYHWTRYEPKSMDHIDINLDISFSKRKLKEEFTNGDEKKDDFGNWKPKENLDMSFNVDGIDYNINTTNKNYVDFMNGNYKGQLINKEIKDLYEVHKKMHVKSQEGLYSNRLQYTIPRIAKDMTETGFMKYLFNEFIRQDLHKQEEGLEGTGSEGKTNTKDSRFKRLLRWLFTKFLDVDGDIADYKNKFTKTDAFEETLVEVPVIHSRYMNPDDVSDDIFSSSFAYHMSVKRTKYLLDSLPLIQLIREEVKTPNKGDVKNKSENYRYSRINNIIEMNIENKKGSINFWTKMVKVFQQLAIIKSQSILNPEGNIKNYIAGKAVNFINLDKQTYLKATWLSFSNHIKLYNSVFHFNGEVDKDIAIFKFFNPGGENFRKVFNVRNSFFNKNNFDEAFYGARIQGESNISNEFMYSMLLKTTVYKEVGGSPKKMSLYEALDETLNLDGIYKDESYLEAFTKNDLNTLKKEMRAFRLRTQGQSDEGIAAKQHALGRGLLSMQGFFFPTLYTKWRVGRHYDLNAGKYNRGYVTEFITNLTLGFIDLFQGKNRWSTMTKTEQSDFIKGMISTMLILINSWVIKGLFGYDDDDENEDGVISKSEKEKKYAKLRENSYLKNVLLIQATKILNELEGFALYSINEGNVPIISESVVNFWNNRTVKGNLADIFTLLQDSFVYLKTNGKQGVVTKNDKYSDSEKGDIKAIKTLNKILDPTHGITKYLRKDANGNYLEEHILIQYDKIDKSNFLK